MNQKASGADALQIMAVSFVVAGVLAAALLVDFGGKGRLIDALLGRKDDWESQRPRVNRVELAGDGGASRMMIVNDLSRGDAPASAPVPAAAAPADSTPAAPAKGSWIKHISGSLAQFDIKGPATQHSGASASVTDAPAPSAPVAAPASAPTVAALPTAGAQPAATAQPSYVNYGTTSRSDIMSSASGPVYNFRGKKR